jgi:hypothetical protein
MSILICKKCGLARGQHTAFKEYCPTPDGRFSTVQRFELKVDNLSMDAEAATLLAGKPLTVIEQEVARRVLKNVEASLACYDLRKELSREDVINALAQVRKGYDL